MDTITKEERSEIMSRVKSKNSRPEIFVRSFLHRSGFRFRIHVKNLPGKPDIVLPKYKAVVFVNGCFWHGHSDSSCKLARMPKSNTEFWQGKITKNHIRDVEKQAQLCKLGWRVFVVWECQLAHPEKILSQLGQDIASVKNDADTFEYRPQQI